MRYSTIISKDRICVDDKVYVLGEDNSTSYGCTRCPFFIDAGDKCDLVNDDWLFKMCDDRFSSNGNQPVRFTCVEGEVYILPKSKTIEMSEDQLHIISQIL